MSWKSTSESLPVPMIRVWVLTESGRRTTAYLQRNGEWFLFCQKIAAENPKIVSWRE